MATAIEKLTALAKVYMLQSTDPVHDLAHVQRVVAYADRIARAHHLTKDEYDAVILAAWWHDVSRTIFKGTSFVALFFFDDLISACLLWFWTVRFGLFGSVAGIATRLILCKSKTPFANLFKYTLRKRTRLLFNILEDADNLDMLHIERATILCSMSTYSPVHRVLYRIVAHWWTSKDRLNLQTKEAKTILKELLAIFLEWTKQVHTISFHLRLFGPIWAERTLTRFQNVDRIYMTV